MKTTRFIYFCTYLAQNATRIIPNLKLVDYFVPIKLVFYEILS